MNIPRFCMSSNFKLKSKFIVVFLLISSLALISNTAAKAAFSQVKLDSELVKETSITKPLEKIIFSPVKINSVLKSTPEKYAQEISYFFHKAGFAVSPASYILFEDGNVLELNPDWKISQFESSTNNGVLFSLLAYSSTFSLDKFKDSINEFNNSVLKANLDKITLDSADNISLQKFLVEKDEASTKVLFSNYDTAQDRSLRDFFDDLDFKRKVLPELKISSISDINEADSNSIATLKIEIKNNSGFDFIFSEKDQLKFSFEKDSQFFVNNTWLNQRTALMADSGFVRANSTTTFEVQLQSPILAGEYEETIQISLNDNRQDQREFKLTVRDSGQKALKILESGLGYLNIREEPSINSSEIGKAPTGNVYLYSELQDGYYRISFDGKEGWISSRYVEILE